MAALAQVIVSNIADIELLSGGTRVVAGKAILFTLQAGPYRTTTESHESVRVSRSMMLANVPGIHYDV